MRKGAAMAGFSLFLMAWMCGCGSGSGASTPTSPAQVQVASPTISTKAALAGAQIISLADNTSGAAIHYTIDGATPTAASPIYAGPFLVASNLTLNAYATLSGDKDSPVATQKFAPNIASGTLVWSDEFANTTGSNQQPNPTVWTYDTIEEDEAWQSRTGRTYCALEFTQAMRFCQP